MTQEDKELLLRDLCARLPYGVICRTRKEYTSDSDFVDKEPIKGILIDICYDVEKVTLKHIPLTVRHNYDFSVEEIKPYLRSMSSMTMIEKRVYATFIYGDQITVKDMIDLVDWLNKHHFDYRGLIKKGIAIEVTEGNNPYK